LGYIAKLKLKMNMKKQLLLGSALMFTLIAYPQNNQKKLQVAGITNTAEKVNQKSRILESETPSFSNKAANPTENTSVIQPNSVSNSASSPIISSVFNRFSGSMNVFGFLVSNQKALSYNRHLKTFCFIQRKSPTYVTNPALNANAQSGAIVAYLGQDDGTTWDSTLIQASNTNWARYPQGGIYNPPGNTTFTNAYVVGSGPVTQVNTSLGWIGSWYASKRLTSPGTNSVGTDVQFFSNAGPNYGSVTSPAMIKQDFPRNSFTSTDDGVVRAVGSLNLNVNDVSSNVAYGLRGFSIAKGLFTSGAFVWTADTIIPPTNTLSATMGSGNEGSKVMFGTPYMAFNDAGTHGYFVVIGSRMGSTGSNIGYQPIVYKTTNSGNSWVLVNGIDFNTGNWDKLKNSMLSTNTTTYEIPFFKTDEGIDVTVDKDNKLHIVSTVVGTARAHTDSVGYTWQFKSPELYAWLYEPNAYPYIFDFSGDGTGTWNHTLIDSLSSEGPSSTSGDPGFGSNPWGSSTAGESVNSDSRIQVSRSYDGEFLLYSWAESDTTLTTGGVKWNEFPNIKQRALRLCDGAVSTDELAISSPAVGFNARVRDKAYFHFMSSTCKAGGSTATAATFTTAYTVSNNVATDGITAVDNFYANAIVTHSFASSACGASVTTGVSAAKTEANQSTVFPNPTHNNVTVQISLTQAKDVTVDIYNAIGQVVSSTKTNGQLGVNTINVNLNNANAGVYFVKIKAGSSESTKKLIVE